MQENSDQKAKPRVIASENFTPGQLKSLDSNHVVATEPNQERVVKFDQVEQLDEEGLRLV